MDRDEPVTEARTAEAYDLDLRTTLELVELMNRAGAEHDGGAGRDGVARLVQDADVVVLVSAGGRTPFVLGAARAAAAAQAFTVCVVSAPDSKLAALCDRTITVVVGPELLAGS